MKRIILSGLIAGVLLFILCYGGLYLGIRFFPALFMDYNNPLFNSDGNRDVFFYMHAFIISFALSWFWDRFKGLFHGHFILRGLESVLYTPWCPCSLLCGSPSVRLTLRSSWSSAGSSMDFSRQLLQEHCLQSSIPELCLFSISTIKVMNVMLSSA